MLTGCSDVHVIPASAAIRQRRLPSRNGSRGVATSHHAQALTVRPTRCTNLKRQCCCHSLEQRESSDAGGSTSNHQVAVEGDMVSVQYKCMNNKGEIIETSEVTEPLTFEVGAGEVMGNKMFQASGGEWNKELLFAVPRAHDEVQRLEGRYKNVGGLKEGLVVELTNGSNAMVLAVTDDTVRLDANNMMAGQTLMFELELISIEPGRNAGAT